MSLGLELWGLGSVAYGPLAKTKATFCYSQSQSEDDMSYSVNSLRGLFRGLYRGNYSV